jgi:hypothetical protein
MNIQNNTEFYHAVACLLGTTYNCSPFPYRYRTRWNNRVAGSGRFPNYGIVRLFGDKVHIALIHPVEINEIVEGKQTALDLIAKRLEDK